MKKYHYLSSNKCSWLLSTITAGVAGGLAEVIWILIYYFDSPASALEVARQISVTIFPATVEAYYAPILGIIIHLLLSLFLAFVFAYTALLLLFKRYGKKGIYLGSLITLAVVWKINFFVVLPLINPSFISMMPFYATLFSKLLFGTAMAWVMSSSLSLECATPHDTGKVTNI